MGNRKEIWADKFNKVENFDVDQIIENAERRLGPHGYIAGTDQWLMWEMIYNLALNLKDHMDE